MATPFGGGKDDEIPRGISFLPDKSFYFTVERGFYGWSVYFIGGAFYRFRSSLVVPPTRPRKRWKKNQPLQITDYEHATIEVVNKVGPSVVMITTTSLVEVKDFSSG